MNEREAFEFSEWVLRYLKMELTPEEEDTFLQTIASDVEKQELLFYYKNAIVVEQDLPYLDKLDSEDAWNKVITRASLQASEQPQKKQIPLWRWSKYVAILVATVGIAVWWHSGEKDSRVITDNQFGFKNDVLPGGNKATLLLSNGNTVLLNQSEKFIEEGRRAISIAKNGELNYRKHKADRYEGINEIQVPDGGQYKVVLSDGTQVWVNSYSKLRFPVQFNGGERRVFLEGEAFFDVAKDTNRPFYVEVAGKTIQVLGTQFNVSAYAGEVLTTLVEGAVKVADNRFVRSLKPGQQAAFKPSGITVAPAYVDKVVAWKEGYFLFDQDTIQTIMDQIARWYKVEVHYQGKIQPDVYSGSIPRTSTLGGVLQMLRDVSNLQFEIDGTDVSVRNVNQE